MLEIPKIKIKNSEIAKALGASEEELKAQGILQDEPEVPKKKVKVKKEEAPAEETPAAETEELEATPENLAEIKKAFTKSTEGSVTGTLVTSVHSDSESADHKPELTKEQMTAAFTEVSNEQAEVHKEFVARNAEKKAEKLQQAADAQKAAVERMRAAEAPKETPVEAPKEDEPAKKSRRKAPKAECGDLTAVIECLGSDVPDDMQLEDVIKEIRQIRDLMLVASRRTANLSLKYLEKAEKAEAVMTQLKGILTC